MRSAWCFIIVGLSASAFGFIDPIIAAMLHVAGTLIVIFNSARLVRKGEELEHFIIPKPIADTKPWRTDAEAGAS